jgi:Tol biopolymer transport system component
MRILRGWAAAALLALSACLVHPTSEGRPAARGARSPLDAPERSIADLRDNPIPPLSAEPPWRDLVRHTRLLPPARVWHPSASPDGGLVAYASTEFGPRVQIALRKPDVAAPIQISKNAGDNFFPRISPCGKRIAYASNREGNWDIYVARIDAPAVVTQVTLDESDDLCPSWSPDGRRLVYCSRRRGSEVWQLVICEVGSRVKTFLGPGLYPDWSPEGEGAWICFQSQPSPPDGKSSVRVVRPDGTELREVAGDKTRRWSALQPRFSPCGGWIAFATLRRSVESRLFGAPDAADDLWMIRTDGRYEMRLTEDPSGESWPAWGGDRVFFVSDRDGGINLYSVKVKPFDEDRP